MAFLRPDFALAEKALAIGGLVALFGGFAALLYGEFAPSVGLQGLVDQGIGAAGLLVMGVGVLCFAPLVARDPWRARPRASEGRRALLREAALEAGVVALNLVCYAGTAIVALGALSAFDRAPVATGITMAACVAVFALYRRHRKRRPRSYELAKPLGIILLMLAFGLAAGALGALGASNAIADALEGPREQVCSLSDFEERRPTGRYSSLRAAELVVEFVGEDGEPVRVSVKEQDRAVLQQIVDAGGAARIAYYPRTGVFAGARPAPAVY